MKKLMSILLAMAIVFTFSVTAFAYDTEVVYSAAALHEDVDADGDGVTDGTITDETPYLLVVPEEITVDGGTDTVYISGIVDTEVIVTVPTSVSMNDESGNNLSANILMDSLILPVSITQIGNANANISSTWNDAPLTGAWNGNFMYTVQ